MTCKEAIGDLPSLAKKTGNEEADYQAKATSKYQETMRKGSKKAIEPCPNKPPTTCDRRNQKSTGGW